MLEEPIVSGVGRVRLGDTTWRVQGPDLPAGTAVRIAASNGGVLTVAPVAKLSFSGHGMKSGGTRPMAVLAPDAVFFTIRRT